ncbi:hypothetical protein CLF_111899 [Clonorchis sinensis]|uniref:Uncharacterized protein n=1 Tax=Clonorchis sinensis TaxID=79923 RepID=G7YM32_CLOSI|nr:hypothetical protein CLF_111899 [Clonorchis sinensis]
MTILNGSCNMFVYGTVRESSARTFKVTEHADSHAITSLRDGARNQVSTYFNVLQTKGYIYRIGSVISTKEDAFTRQSFWREKKFYQIKLVYIFRNVTENISKQSYRDYVTDKSHWLQCLDISHADVGVIELKLPYAQLVLLMTMSRPCVRSEIAIMSPVNTVCSLRPSMDHNRCGRSDCLSNVRRGMRCHTCKARWQFKGTGLPDDQSQKVRCKCSVLVGILEAKLELPSKAPADANTKNAETWAKVDKELSSVNDYLALFTPGRLAEIKVIQLSDALSPRAPTVKASNMTTANRNTPRKLLGHTGSGNSGVHTCTKEKRLQPNELHTIRQNRKLLARFKHLFATHCGWKARRAAPILSFSVWSAVASRVLRKMTNSLYEPLSNSPPAATHLLLVCDFNAPKPPWMEPQHVGSSELFAAALTKVVQKSAWSQHVVEPDRYRHFVDQVSITAPLGHSDNCVLAFGFICYWDRNPEPQMWLQSFCRTDFSGMRILLEQASTQPDEPQATQRDSVPSGKQVSTVFKKLTARDREDELAFRKMRNRCKSEIR